jgi:hypothetical protein
MADHDPLSAEPVELRTDGRDPVAEHRLVGARELGIGDLASLGLERPREDVLPVLGWSAVLPSVEDQVCRGLGHFGGIRR